MDKFVELTAVSKHFDTKKGRFQALADVNLSIARGEFVALIGHSGCGKSTVLNLIAGLLDANEGGLICNGREIDGPGPERAVVFQNHSLLPWMTCFGNVHLAVEKVFGARENKAQLKARTEQALNMVGLSHAMHKHPNEISGGMKQRVGIARALAMEPKVLLMDEPFGALDAFTREQMQELLLQVWQRTAKPVFLITHDIEEAVFLATDLILLAPNPGRVVERLHLDFGQRYAAGESARSIKSDPRFIETREHVLARVFSQRSAAGRQEIA